MRSIMEDKRYEDMTVAGTQLVDAVLGMSMEKKRTKEGKVNMCSAIREFVEEKEQLRLLSEENLRRAQESDKRAQEIARQLKERDQENLRLHEEIARQLKERDQENLRLHEEIARLTAQLRAREGQ